MLRVREKKIRYFVIRVLQFALLIWVIGAFVQPSEAGGKFDRVYNTQGKAHLTIANINGSIIVTAWNRKTIVVNAMNESSTPIVEDVIGNNINLSVKKSTPPRKVNFLVLVPANTSIILKNYIGKIEVRGLRGEVSIKSYDSDVRLIDLRVPSIDVNVTTGDIFFDGELTG